MLEITIKKITDGSLMLDTARTTVWKKCLSKEPSYNFKDNAYMSEHSIIRTQEFFIEIKGIKSWVATHFVRHHVGITPFVSTQRDDRLIQDTPRDELPQGALVNLSFIANAQALINMASKRLCFQAHKETREVMLEIKRKLEEIEPSLADKLVPQCVREGFCREFNCCGYCRTEGAKQMRIDYIGNRQTINIDI